nr:hypothetical transcript [Hymenolepis microstoma]
MSICSPVSSFVVVRFVTQWWGGIETRFPAVILSFVAQNEQVRLATHVNGCVPMGTNLVTVDLVDCQVDHYGNVGRSSI